MRSELVAATAAVGGYARHRGVLSPDGVKVLEHAVAEIFTPALILLKVLPNVRWEAVAAVWPMALSTRRWSRTTDLCPIPHRS